MQDVLADKRDSYVDILTCFDVNWLKRRDPDPNYIINILLFIIIIIIIVILINDDYNDTIIMMMVMYTIIIVIASL